MQGVTVGTHQVCPRQGMQTVSRHCTYFITCWNKGSGVGQSASSDTNMEAATRHPPPYQRHILIAVLQWVCRMPPGRLHGRLGGNHLLLPILFWVCEGLSSMIWSGISTHGEAGSLERGAVLPIPGSRICMGGAPACKPQSFLKTPQISVDAHARHCSRQGYR